MCTVDWSMSFFDSIGFENNERKVARSQKACTHTLRASLGGLQLRLLRQFALEPYQTLRRWNGSTQKATRVTRTCEKVEQAES